MTPVNYAIAALNSLPLDAKVVVRTVWSNGNKIRRYSGQDKPGADVKKTAPERGFRKMTVILIEEVDAE